jgi:putative Holliday junction resolvase
VKQLLTVQSADVLVVGLPISLDGALHHQGERVKQEALRLGKAVGMPVSFWDEGFSTVIAEERLQESPTSEHRKTTLDAAAAAVILESYFAASESEREALIVEGNRDDA